MIVMAMMTVMTVMMVMFVMMLWVHVIFFILILIAFVDYIIMMDIKLYLCCSVSKNKKIYWQICNIFWKRNQSYLFNIISRFNLLLLVLV